MRRAGTSLTPSLVLAPPNVHLLVYSLSFVLTTVATATIWLAFLLAFLHLWTRRKSLDSAVTPDEPQAAGIRGAISRHVARVGGLTIFSFKVSRFLALAAHLGLVVATGIHQGWSRLSVVLAEASVSTERG